MAREICSAAWPLNSVHNPVIITSHDMSGETGRCTAREGDVEESTGGPLHLFSQGDISPPTVWLAAAILPADTGKPLWSTFTKVIKPASAYTCQPLSGGTGTGSTTKAVAAAHFVFDHHISSVI
ncbi:hypothetical protein CRENBAI_008220 [Crenichthys baileyi]|uniref:Uncharacterized protein n=1 Tax=Crenichthys baileyi TaxID=28760 RepID=A0AAV9RN31_9TELE